MIQIKITRTAQEHFRKLLASQKEGTHLRIYVTNPGTYYAECGVAFCLPHSILEDDLKLKYEHFSIYIDVTSAPWVEDAEIDFVKNKDSFESELILNTPKIKDLIEPLDDVSLKERIQSVLNMKINPQLQEHGGYVTLTEITPEGFVILNFSGGCNGCSMAAFTLKEHIEKTLLHHFPQLQGVQDTTEHQRGPHSYY
ncbi:MAG: NifU family protein [Candidatus Dasytiphilus stammeri]